MNLNSVIATVNVAGNTIEFAELELNQSFNNHHRCTIKCDFDAFGDKKWMSDPVKHIKFIGESISITFSHTVTGETNIFTGIVSNVAFDGWHGANNQIIIHGVSETIKLDGKPHMDCFVDKTLEDIVNESVANSGNGASVIVKPEYKNPIPYQIQHNESCFDFLNRLSYLYGETFYYTGTEIKWGKLDLEDAVDIKYDMEMTHFNLSANLQPPKFRHYNYIQYYDEEKVKETQKSIPDAAGYLQPVLDKSDSIYTSEVTTPELALVDDSDSLLNLINIERTRDVANMLILSGSTQTCKVGIGKVVTISFPGELQIDTDPGAFVVTHIEHTIDHEGHYSNTFSGVRAALGYIPVTNVKLPLTGALRATVLSNADPRGKGRIMVQTQWMKLIGKNTNWIRVVSPDAGGTGHVSKNRGYVFIPEEGDDVMLLFEENDPARPYCSGSLFPEPIAKGGYNNNHLKTIMTRSGHTIALDDSDESLGITVKDRKGNLIFIDSANNNITVTALNDMTLNATETMTFNCKNMVMNIGESQNNSIGTDQETSIGQKQSVVVGDTISISATNMEEAYSDKSKTTVQNDMTTEAGFIDIYANQKDIVIKTVGKALVQGEKDARISKG